MGVIASLIVKIAADQAELVQGSKESVAHLDKIRDSTESLSKGLESFENLAVRVGERMAAAFAIREVVSFAGNLANAGREARNLGLEVGANVEKIQAIAAATADYGMDTEKTGRAVYQLSRRIAGNDESAAVAVHTLGLSMSTLKQQSPDQLLLTIADASNELTNAQTKSVVMADLFGARMGAALVATSGHLRETMEDVQRTGGVMDKDAVESAAHFADSLDHLKLRFQALALDGIKPAFDWLDRWINKSNGQPQTPKTGPLPGSLSQKEAQQMYASGQMSLDQAYFAMQRGQSGSGPTGAITIDQAKGAAKAPGSFSFGGRGLSIDEGTLTQIAGPGAQAQKFLDSLKSDATKKLTEPQREFMNSLRDLSALSEKNAAVMDVTVAQYKIYVAEQEKAKEAAKQLLEYKKKIGEIEAGGMHAMSELHQWYEEIIKNQKTLNEESLKYLGLLAHFADLKDDASSRIGASGAGPAAPKTIQDKLEDDYQNKLTAAKEVTRDQTRWTSDPITGKPIHPELTGDALGKAQEARIAQEQAAFVEFNDGMVRAGLVAKNVADAHGQVVTAAARVTSGLDAMSRSTGKPDDGLSPEIAGTRGAPGSRQYEAWQKNHGIFFQNLPPHRDGGPVNAGPAMLHDNEYVVPSGGALVRGGGSGGVGPLTINVSGIMDDSAKRRLAEDIAHMIFSRAKAGQKFGNAG